MMCILSAILYAVENVVSEREGGELKEQKVST